MKAASDFLLLAVLLTVCEIFSRIQVENRLFAHCILIVAFYGKNAQQYQRNLLSGMSIRVGEKQAIFSLYASISRKNSLLLMTNSRLHMRFQLAPRSMILDDLELLEVRSFSEFRVISQMSEATAASEF